MIIKTAIVTLSILTVSFGLISCASISPTPPCYDGWTSNKSGASVIWSPNLRETKSLETNIPDHHKVKCYHQTPDMKITVLTEFQKKLFYFEFEQIGEEFSLIDDGIISTHN